MYRRKVTEVERLELENKQMEERLRQFRETMAQQKAKRSFKGDSTWSSGLATKGSLNSYAKDVLTRRKKGYQGIENEVKLEMTKEQKIPTIQHNGQHNGPTQFRVPVPPSAERTNRPSVKRMWRVPTPLQDQKLETITEEEPNSLLHGEFDEHAGHQSFLDALNQWRNPSVKNDKPNTLEVHQNNSEISATSLLHGEFDERHQSFLEALNQWRKGGLEDRPNSNEGQQTDLEPFPPNAVEMHLKFESKRSYLDQITLNSKDIVNQPIQTLEKMIIKSQREENIVYDWDEQDEKMLLEILTKQTKPSTPKPKEEEVDVEELRMFQEIMSNRHTRYMEHVKNSLVITDVTDNEDDVILEALNKGQMVECIPFSKLVILE